jgi:hypothetical protein
MEKLGAVEGFPIAVPLHDGDGHGFHPLVGGEAEIAVQALTAASHTPSGVSGS